MTRLTLFALRPDGRWVPWKTVAPSELLSDDGWVQLADQAHEAGFVSVSLDCRSEELLHVKQRSVPLQRPVRSRRRE
jgi:hypothetical protein